MIEREVKNEKDAKNKKNSSSRFTGGVNTGPYQKRVYLLRLSD